MARAFPQGSPEPKPKMPMWKTIFTMAIAVVLDGLKLISEFLIFFAPVLLGVGAYALAGGGVKGQIAAGVTAVGSSAIEVFGGAVPIEILGALGGMLIGFVGWLFFILSFTISGINLFKRRSRFTNTIVGWIATEIPILDALPTFTYSIGRIVWDVRKEDKEKIVAWKAENETLERKFVGQRNAQAFQARRLQMQAAANDAAYADEAADDASYNEETDARVNQQAANDPDYEKIPEKTREAA